MRPASGKGLCLIVCALMFCLAAFATGGSQTVLAAPSRVSDEPPPPQDSVETDDSEEEVSLPVPPDLLGPGADAQSPTPQVPAPPASSAPPATPAAGPTPPRPTTPPPAQAGPKPITPKSANATPVVPAGPPGYPDILFREFSGSWTGGPLMFHWWVSHSGNCTITYPGGHLDFVMDRSQGDNGYPVSKTVSDFPVKGGKVVLTCHGIAPDPAMKSQEITIGPAPVSTQTVTVQKTKVVRRATKHGKRTVKAVKVTTQVTLPIPPAGVSGWCYTNSKGVWGFIQAPVAGSTRSLYTPGYGAHCDPPRVKPAEWRLYLNTFYHGKDPRKK